MACCRHLARPPLAFTLVPLPQGNLLLLVQRLMQGGSLQMALQQPGKRDALRWGER